MTWLRRYLPLTPSVPRHGEAGDKPPRYGLTCGSKENPLSLEGEGRGEGEFPQSSPLPPVWHSYAKVSFKKRRQPRDYLCRTGSLSGRHARQQVLH